MQCNTPRMPQVALRIAPGEFFPKTADVGASTLFIGRPHDDRSQVSQDAKTRLAFANLLVNAAVLWNEYNRLMRFMIAYGQHTNCTDFLKLLAFEDRVPRQSGRPGKSGDPKNTPAQSHSQAQNELLMSQSPGIHVSLIETQQLTVFRTKDRKSSKVLRIDSSSVSLTSIAVLASIDNGKKFWKMASVILRWARSRAEEWRVLRQLFASVAALPRQCWC